MALQLNGLATAMEREILRRYEMRGISKEIRAAERRKIETTVGQIKLFAPDRATAVMRAFLDYTFPVGPKSFRPVQNLYFEWRGWSTEVYPTIAHLFPVTAEDEDIISCFFKDWRALRSDKNYYRNVYRRPSVVGGARIEAAYHHTPDFFRVLGVLRAFQQDDSMSRYPLFTLRAYLASQIEALAGYVATLKIGNVVSEKAKDRFDEWYLYRFYNLELVKKGLKRPSDNNPVSNPVVREEYEHIRADETRGDFTLPDETPVPWMTRPARSFGGGKVSDASIVVTGVKLPPGMGNLLR